MNPSFAEFLQYCQLNNVDPRQVPGLMSSGQPGFFGPPGAGPWQPGAGLWPPGAGPGPPGAGPWPPGAGPGSPGAGPGPRRVFSPHRQHFTPAPRPQDPSVGPGAGWYGGQDPTGTGFPGAHPPPAVPPEPGEMPGQQYPPPPPAQEMMRQQAQHLKDAGNDAVKQRDLATALNCYSKGLELAFEVPDNEDQIKFLLGNRSRVLCDMGQYQQSLKDAEECISIAPTWPKGYQRLSKVHEKCGRLQEAISSLVDGLSSASEQADVNYFLQYIFDMLPSTPETFVAGVFERLEEMDCGSENIWDSIVKHVVSKKNWVALMWLTLGTEKTPGLVDSFNAREVFLRDVYSETKLSLNKRIKLLITCLKNGSPWWSLGGTKAGSLHTAVGITMESGDVGNLGLLRELFTKHVQDPKERNVCDDSGNNLLHIVCQHSAITLTLRDTLIRFLLANDVDPHAVNRQRKLPVDLLPHAASSSRHLLPPPHNTIKLLKQRVHSADELFRVKNFYQAISLYKESFDIFEKLSEQDKNAVDRGMMSEMMLNAGVCLWLLGKPEEALSYAQRCCESSPECVKGHLLWAKLMLKIDGYTSNVQQRLASVYLLCQGVTERAGFLQEVVEMTCSLQANQVRDCLSALKADSKMWVQVVCHLGPEKGWSDIRRLLATNCLQGANLKKLDYSYLVAALGREDWTNWGEALVIDLLEKKADVKHVKKALEAYTQCRCDSVMRGAVELALWHGSLALFYWLLHHYYDAVNEVLRRYDRGDTLLHVVCACVGRQPALSSKKTAKLIEVLIEKGLKSGIKNRFGKTAMDLLPRGHPLCEVMRHKPKGASRHQPGSQNVSSQGSHRKRSPCIENIQAANSSSSDKHAFDKLTCVYDAEHCSEDHSQHRAAAFEKVSALAKKNNSTDVPEALLKKLLVHEYQRLVSVVVAGELWHKLTHLLTVAKTAVSPVTGLMLDTDLSLYVRSKYCKNDPNKRLALLNEILDQGADVSGINKPSPLQTALDVGDYAAISVLLKRGARLEQLTLHDGDTPLHAALDIALIRDPGNFDILKVALKIKEAACCSPSCQDVEGNTLFHTLALEPFSEHSIHAANLLLEANVNPMYFNKEEKTAVQCLQKKNSRLRGFIELAAKKFPEEPEVQSRKSKVKSQKVEEIKETSRSTAEILDNIEKLIAEVDVASWQSSQSAILELDRDESQRGCEAAPSGEEAGQEEEVGEEEEEEEPGGPNEPAPTEGDDMADIDCRLFDNLAWEVVCSADVWKCLKKTQKDLQRRAIKLIQQLARGVWQPSYTKTLVHQGPSEVKLYSAKLTKGARIIWEIPVMFSAKRSTDNAGLEEDGEGRKGRIYSEIIRIWDIVLNHDNIHKYVEKIIRSHKRGEDCIVKRYVQGTREEMDSKGIPGQARNPQLFMEVDDSKHGQLGTVVQRICPPGSPEPTEYHIMKFYSVNASLLLFLLHNQDSRSVDFPFCVTEKEHAIINLNPSPLAPILLLGRSGTGKTTCCLYRLWSMFVKYWRRAMEADDALLPRDLCYTYNAEGTSTDLAEVNEDAGIASTSVDAAPEVCAAAAAADDAADAADEEEEHPHQPQYDHLHQLFVTKNGVLCSEVLKNFNDLCRGTEEASRYLAAMETSNQLPNRLQEVHPDGFPLFLTSKQLWLMLDASLGAPFYFSRLANGSMRQDIEGWGDLEAQVNFIPHLTEDDGMEEAMIDQRHEHPAGQTRTKDQRREVTYEVFAFELWPKLNKDKLPYHPTLVWTEIVSFITGSVQSLHSETGHLTLDEYEKLGRKKAPNFTGDRAVIHELFHRYRKMKRHFSLFDEADLVHDLFKRLREGEERQWVLHQIYVDETQDFTQAELCLLLHLCQDPNNMFFTGDTAQSIMRGVSFRFEDLRSLFFYARDFLRPLGKKADIQVPSAIYKLPINYRSHRGILNLASSIVELLEYFFPDTFDMLERDKGLFSGPMPKLLLSCDFADLAVMLSGHKRETSHIEFGAHQAVIVVSDEARQRLPEELSSGLVLTIFESKGLEFDDVLLYNFFKDSQAQKEWRVVTEYLRELEQNVWRQEDTDEFTQIVYVDLEGQEKARPLAFDPEKHKVLNSELKHLYTAMTRARVNVWIYDEDPVARAPMFEFFRARDLVQVHQTNEALTEEVFARSTGPDQWKAQGDRFYKRHLYHVAAKCYKLSGNVDMMHLCFAHVTALEANQHPMKSPQLRSGYVAAAELYVKCGKLVETARCLLNARQPLLAAKLYQSIGQYSDAAVIFLRHGRIREACGVYENALDFESAIVTYKKNKMYAEAMDCVERYNIKMKKYQDDQDEVPTAFLQHGPRKHTHSIEELCKEGAKHYLKNREPLLMKEMLNRHLDVEQRISFLITNRCVDDVAPLLKKQGRSWEAAQLYRAGGKLELALQYLDCDTHPGPYAECLLALGRVYVLNRHSGSGDSAGEVDAKRRLEEAGSIFLTREYWSRVGECQLLLGVLLGERTKFIAAINTFRRETKAKIGMIAAAVEWIKEPTLIYGKCPELCVMMKDLMHLLHIMAQPPPPKRSALDEETIRFTLQFYGLNQGETWTVVSHEGARIRQVHPKCDMDIAELSGLIRKDLVTKASALSKAMQEAIDSQLPSVTPCPRHQIGLECYPTCLLQHRERTHHEYMVFKTCMSLKASLAHVIDATYDDKYFLPLPDRLNTEHLHASFTHLYDLLFPKHGHPRLISSNLKQAWNFVSHIRKNAILEEALRLYALRCWELGKKQKRQANSDLIMQVHNLLVLCSGSQKTMKQNLLNEERWIRETLKTNDRSRTLGFHVVRGSGRTVRGLEHFFWNIILCFENIYDKKMPFEATMEVSKLLRFWCNHPEEPLMPSLAVFSFSCELLLLISTCLSLRFGSGGSVLLPASYIAQVHFLDAMYGRPGSTLFSSVHSSKVEWNKCRNQLQGRLHAMVKDLTGASSDQFDPAYDALAQPGSVVTGESERMVVLLLSLLVNTGSQELLLPKNQNLLRCGLKAVDVADAPSYPQRVREALMRAQQARSRHQVIQALGYLLQKRGDEYLHLCTWDKHRHGLHYQRVHPSLSDIRDYVLEEAPGVSDASVEEEEEVYLDDQVRDNHVTSMSEETAGENQGHTTLDGENQGHTMLDGENQGHTTLDGENQGHTTLDGENHGNTAITGSNQGNISTAESNIGNNVANPPTGDIEEESPETPDTDPLCLAKFKVIDESMCGICGVVFSSRLQEPEDDFVNEPESNDGETEPTSPPVTPDTYMSSPPEFVSRECHLDSTSHLQKLQSFKDYQAMLLRQFVPIDESIKQFLGWLDLELECMTKPNQDEAKQTLDKHCEGLSEERKRLRMLRGNVEGSRDWDNRCEVDRCMQELGKLYGEIQTISTSVLGDITRRQSERDHEPSQVERAMAEGQEVLLDVVPGSGRKKGAKK